MNERSLKGKCCRKENGKKEERVGLNVCRRASIGIENAKTNSTKTFRLRASELVLTTSLRCSECQTIDLFYLAVCQRISLSA